MNVAESTRPLTVLVVDHAPVVVQALKRFLESHAGVQVVGAVLRLEEALARVREYAPEVVLVGLLHDDAHSLEQLRQLREALPQAYLIGSSFDLHEEGRGPVLAAGADDFVSGYRLDTDLMPALLRSRER